jgi:hypothetical protein
MALRQFDDPGYIKEIIPLLKDSNPTVQREAVTALRSLGAVIPGEILPLVEKGSEPSGFEVSLSAARALGEMAFSLSEKEQEPLVAGLKALENHAAETVRHAASIALVRMGRKDRNAQWELVNRFVSTNLASSHLSAMYLAEAVALANEERLRRPAELKEKIESMDGLKRALQTVGLELDLGSAAWRVSNIRIREGRKLTWHQVLERSSVSLPFVLDGDTIRCMEPEAALEFWLKRLSDSDK